MIDDSKKSQSQNSRQNQQPSQIVKNQPVNKGKKKVPVTEGNQQSIDFFIKRLDKKSNVDDKKKTIEQNNVA